MIVIDFDSRSDGGPTLVGPFSNDDEVFDYTNSLRMSGCSSCFSVRIVEPPAGQLNTDNPSQERDSQ